MPRKSPSSTRVKLSNRIEDTPMTDKMLSKKQDGIGWMIFNNPERHNAVSLEMWAAAGEILRDFEADPAVRVMILTGNGGKAFVSGADISKFKEERSTLAEVE